MTTLINLDYLSDPTYTLVAEQSGITFYVDTTNNDVTINIPSAISGAIFSFYIYQGTNNCIIQPSGTNRIIGGGYIGTTGQAFQLSPYSMLLLNANNSDYYVMNNGGTITLI